MKIGDLEVQNYVVEVVCAIVPDVTHTEIRCPACVELGYAVPRFFFRIDGMMTVPETPVLFLVHCKVCKSYVQWRYGTNEFEIVKTGVQNHKQEKVRFE